MATESIVYLLGAGASFGTIPLMEKLLAGMEPMFSGNGSNTSIEGLIAAHHAKGQQSRPTLDMQREIRVCIQEAMNYGSIDQYLDGIKERQEQVFLTYALDIYLSIHQGLNPVQKRYRSFISSLFQSEPGSDLYVCPAKVTILSWNFDNQLEIGLRDHIREPETALHWAAGRPTEKLQNAPILYKLNGSAGHLSAAAPRSNEVTALQVLLRHRDHDRDLAEKLAFGLAAFSRTHQSRIQYYWNDPTPGWREILQRIADAKTLVIIGYSLHQFNTRKDQEIIAALKALERIVYQVPKNEQPAYQQVLREILLESGKDPESLRIEYSEPDRFFIPRSIMYGP